jgi:pyruvate/2-oxoglutarate dehydrogenase complex dihydrolipoamide dehydrogenase (E3) component
MSGHYEFLVIGGGSAGFSGAATAVSLGLKTAVIDGGPEVGGLCILRGCMPSKTLLESGHRALAIREADEFGLRAEYRGADGSAIHRRKRRLIGEFADYRRGQLTSGRFDFIRGRARFVDGHAVEVQLLDGGSHRISADTILVATGSVISGPKIEGLDEAGYWDSDEALDADKLPESVCILGGGAIALEFASYYHGLGIPTSVIQRSNRVLKEMDEDVSRALSDAMIKRGISLFVDTKVGRVEKRGGRKVVLFECKGEKREIEADQIIYALGRRPATDNMSLEIAGVVLDHGLIKAGANQRTSVPHIFAAGDICGPYEVVHIAIEQAAFAARNAARTLGRLGGEDERIDYALKLFAVFTHPQVSLVGLTEREAREQGMDFRAASYPFADHGKSTVMGAVDGFVKLIAESRTGRLIGGACVGPEAAELIHEIVVAMRFGATAGQLAAIPHYHPTLSEIWTYPAEDLAGAEPFIDQKTQSHAR